MDNYYFKYKQSMPAVEPDAIRGEIVNQYGRLCYYTITDKNFLDSLPKVCKIDPGPILLAEISGTGLLTPHRDHNLECCLNYYFEPNWSTTIFYKEKQGAVPTKFPGKEISNLYSLDQVEKVASIMAQPRDCYFLNVSEIHGVYAPHPGIRRFITWQWPGVSYKTVLENLIPAL